MTFELAMRQFFGRKAYHIADLAGSTRSRNKWLRKALRKILKDVDDLDTSPRHKQMLMRELEEIDKALIGIEVPTWGLVFEFFSLCSRFLGYDFLQGARSNTPVYHQSLNQHYIQRWLEGRSALKNRREKKDAISVRIRLVKSLNAEGFDAFHIGLIMNMTEYQVKQLLGADRGRHVTRRSIGRSLRSRRSPSGR